MGAYLSLDEVSLSKGEIYTYLTNKNGRGKQGTLVACVKGVRSQDLVAAIEKIPLEKRKQVKEVTLDMANNMNLTAKICFPNAKIVTDRFHVVKLVTEALQHVRIQHRWKAIEDENKAIEDAKKKGEKYKPILLSNGDTKKQLLARCRYVIAKKPSDWTNNQKQRAELMFKLYPNIEKAYRHTLEFRSIYEETSKVSAKKRFELWLEYTKVLEFKNFNTAGNSIKYHLKTILNFFDNRNTNANAESFNSKIKLFRANQRGVRDIQFFLFRLQKLFA
ncbi:transposase [uncultured Dokdonia sp.]|uniref:ISAon1 family transposase n=1 Tax=uncultured Dokdonia sp. TaxID=575653 RepID=UPI002602F6B7|nr:transposase [uncultured Dokdonia sp.]